MTGKMTKVINGYNVIAHEWKSDDRVYVILAERTTDFGHHYVTAMIRNIDTDTEWFWGNYFHGDLFDAVEDYRKRGGL